MRYIIEHRIGGTLQGFDDVQDEHHGFDRLDEIEAKYMRQAEVFRAIKVKRTPKCVTVSEPRFGGGARTITTYRLRKA